MANCLKVFNFNMDGGAYALALGGCCAGFYIEDVKFVNQKACAPQATPLRACSPPPASAPQGLGGDETMNKWGMSGAGTVGRRQNGHANS